MESRRPPRTQPRYLLARLLGIACVLSPTAAACARPLEADVVVSVDCATDDTSQSLDFNNYDSSASNGIVYQFEDGTKNPPIVKQFRFVNGELFQIDDSYYVTVGQTGNAITTVGQATLYDGVPGQESPQNGANSTVTLSCAKPSA